ncbi:hypothetical protein J6590_015473 [Homalodisca vitripennis]|nr:hypothetical protein J6590_015473 [Homalodisca vitripennis]
MVTHVRRALCMYKGSSKRNDNKDSEEMCIANIILLPIHLIFISNQLVQGGAGVAHTRVRRSVPPSVKCPLHMSTVWQDGEQPLAPPRQPLPPDPQVSVLSPPLHPEGQSQVPHQGETLRSRQ